VKFLFHIGIVSGYSNDGKPRTVRDYILKIMQIQSP